MVTPSLPHADSDGLTVAAYPGSPWPLQLIPRAYCTDAQGAGLLIEWTEMLDMVIPRDDLHLHELMDLNIGRPEAIASFLTEHGWLRHLGRGAARQDGDTFVEDVVRYICEQRNAARSGSDPESFYSRRFVLVQEARMLLGNVRNAVRLWDALSDKQDWRALARGWDDDSYLDPPDDALSATTTLGWLINPGLVAFHAGVVPVEGEGRRGEDIRTGAVVRAGGESGFADFISPKPDLHASLCMMVHNDVAAGGRYHRCQNVKCARLFKYKRGGSPAGQPRSTGVDFCSTSCQRSVKQRKYRLRQKAEKKGSTP